MPKPHPHKQKIPRQANQYDKIFRENMEAALPGLMKHLLKIDAVTTDELPDDIQHTRERKPDVLKKVTDSGGLTFVLQVEFQLSDDPDMVLRMAEYYIMLYRRYRLPVRQYVIYIGEGRPRMTDKIRLEQFDFRYALIALSKVDYRIFLRSDKPEEKILAILADFGDQNPGKIVKDIVHQVVAKLGGELDRLRFMKQLRVIAQLRKLASENLEEIMETIAKYFKEENDILYKRGEERKSREVIKNLLAAGEFSIKAIANYASVSEAFVRKVKRELDLKSKSSK